jgi:histone deacetylase 11
MYITYCVEVPVFFVPSEFLRYRLLNPMQLASQGSLDSACLAILYGWSINLSGGYHHATCSKGQGFCIYSDITMIVYYLRKWFPKITNKFMIIDLDAHQGNGYERDLMNDENIYIIDVFNPNIYPCDYYAKKSIAK